MDISVIHVERDVNADPAAPAYPHVSLCTVDGWNEMITMKMISITARLNFETRRPRNFVINLREDGD
jgi:hypothetical protein